MNALEAVEIVNHLLDEDRKRTETNEPAPRLSLKEVGALAYLAGYAERMARGE